MKGKISGEVGRGWGRLIANETASSNLPEPPLNLLFQFCQPVFYRAIARELSRHRLQNRQGAVPHAGEGERVGAEQDRKSTRLNSSHGSISYAVFCLKKKN